MFDSNSVFTSQDENEDKNTKEGNKDDEDSKET